MTGGGGDRRRGGPGRAGRIDWRAVADGAVVIVAVTLPPVLLVRLFKDGDLPGQESNLWVVAVVAMFAGFVLGGHRAAMRRLDAPLLHASVAAATAAGVMASVVIVRRLVTGAGVTVPLVVTLLLLLQITVSLAVIGGYVAVRREAAATRRIDLGSPGEPPAADDAG